MINSSDYPIDCTGDVCTGDTVLFAEAVFGGSHHKPRFLGHRRIAATITRDSYGAAKQQHTFSIRVLASDGYQALAPGTTTTRKSRNLYRNGTPAKPGLQNPTDNKSLRKNTTADTYPATRATYGKTHMTSSELSAICLSLWGERWQADLARFLDVNPRSVRRWASGDVPVPDRIGEQLTRHLNINLPRPEIVPRDEWIFQISDGRRSYIVHTLTPRFIARLVECDQDGVPLPSEGKVDALSGITYQTDDLLLCEISWIDSPSPDNELTDLLHQAIDALHDDVAFC